MNGAGASPSNNSLYYINCYKPPVLITIKASRKRVYAKSKLDFSSEKALD
jgi:hypothetical protein